ncbi:MAG: hypothetical protein ABUL58_02025 [Steroidobacter sp.]
MNLRCANRIKLAMILLCVVILLEWSATYAKDARESDQPIKADANAAGAFVQDFYDWYSPLAFREKNSLPWESALRQREELFSLKLVYALKRDSLATSNIDGTYTGLDFDPFLNTDNSCEHYLVGQVLEYTKNFRAEIQPVCNGKLHPKATVYAEIVFKKNHWQFTNFYYPEGRDLFQVLAELRKERRNDLK